MEGLSLQIADKWAVLDEGVSISVEENSPIWGEGNSFSFPFELDVESNRHIIGNSDQLTGESVYKVLDGQPAVLYVMGVPLYYGKISLDDEVEIADGRVEVTLISGNLTFDEMIDGMNCQDVPLKDEIVVGRKWDNLIVNIHKKGSSEILGEPREWPAPQDVMEMKNGHGESTVNVSKPYPQAAYCNTRIAYKLPKKENNESLSEENKSKFQERGNYLVLDADRTNSGLCFYVLYFLECLFKHLGVKCDLTNIRSVEDMDRLAFFNTGFKYKKSEILRSKNWPTYFKFKSFNGSGDNDNILYFYDLSFENDSFYCIATSENFPDTDVDNLLKSLKSAFLLRFYTDNVSRGDVKAVYLKDVLTDNSIKNIGNAEIFEIQKIENNISGYKLCYNASEEDNTEYNYNEWDNPILYDWYNLIKSKVAPFNKRLYIHNKTGNAYRIKVDGESTVDDNLNESLFEVGAYNAVCYGDCSDENKVETSDISFSPITVNDVMNGVSKEVLWPMDDAMNDQLFAVLLDVEMLYPKEYEIEMEKVSVMVDGSYRKYPLGIRYFSDQPFNEDVQKTYTKYKTKDGLVRVDLAEEESPIQTLSTGFMLGLMRGPGRDAGVEEFDENYDEEGNSKYVVVSSDYAFHSDYVDNYARLFDYNGTEPGGVDTSGRFSLKLRSEKPNPNGGYFPITETYAQKRGLFDKFHAEYAYFVVNRKIVRLTLRMELADLASIDWTKRYKIGDYVGFVNKYSYTVDNTGMSDVTLEMYYL